MDASTFLIGRYQDLPGVAELEALGARILTIAFVVWLAVELVRLLTRGACDFATPFVKVGIGFFVVTHIGWIGDALKSLALGISGAMGDESELALFSRAFTYAVGQVYEQSALATLANLFSFKIVFLFLACGLFFAMMLVKLIVIDIGWPIVFTLVLLLGLIAAPLGVLPGGRLGGWLQNLLEVALWPVIFQLLVALTVGSFSGLLEEVTRLDIQALFAQSIVLGTEDGPAQAVQAFTRPFRVMLQFGALCVAYTLIALYTPKIAHVAMGSAPVTALTGAIGAKLEQIAMLAGGAVAGTAIGAKFAAGAGLGGAGKGSGSAPSASNQASAQGAGAGGAEGPDAIAVKSGAPSVRDRNGFDRRQYPGAPVRPKEDGHGG